MSPYCNKYRYQYLSQGNACPLRESRQAQLLGCLTHLPMLMAERRLPLYLPLPLRHHSIMIEPMLSAVNLRPFFSAHPRVIENVSVGGESGPDARPCEYAWVLDVHMQCVENGVSFSYHQTGARLIKGGKVYNIPREAQHSQAHKAGLDFNGVGLIDIPGE